MRDKEFIDKFILFEKDCSLIDLKFQSVPIWELIRRDVYLNLHSKILGANLSKERHAGKSLIKYLISFLKGFFFKNPFFINTDTELIVSSSSRKKNHNGSYEDIYIDRLLREINLKFSIIESHSKFNHFKSEHKNLTFYFDVISFPSFILSKLIFITPEQIKKVSKEINLSIEKYFGLKADDLEDILISKYYLFRYSKNIMDVLLSKINPKKYYYIILITFLIRH